MPPKEFEPAIPASEHPQTYVNINIRPQTDSEAQPNNVLTRSVAVTNITTLNALCKTADHCCVSQMALSTFLCNAVGLQVSSA